MARLRYLEPPGEQPYLRSIIPQYVSEKEQAKVEHHIAAYVAPVILQHLRYRDWHTLTAE